MNDDLTFVVTHAGENRAVVDVRSAAGRSRTFVLHEFERRTWMPRSQGVRLRSIRLRAGEVGRMVAMVEAAGAMPRRHPIRRLLADALFARDLEVLRLLADWLSFDETE